MKNLRRDACDPTLILLAATLLGCSAGVKAGQAGTAGSSGGTSSGQGGSGHAGTTGTGGNGSGTAGATGSGNTDGGNPTDGSCGGENVGAVYVPLDLYFLMDSSKSMLDNTGSGTSKWMAVETALGGVAGVGGFFNDPGSAGLGVALKYFPDEAPGAPVTCMANTDCSAGGFGLCDFRNTCVATGASTTAVSPLCIDASTCGAQTCSRIKTCAGGTYCAAGPTAPSTACSGCTDFAGYCQLRDICTPAKYATPDVALMTLPGGAGALSSSLMNHTPDGYTPTGPALAGAISWAQGQQSSAPGHKVAVVLVTDGLPGGFIPGFPPPGCMPSDVATIASSILTKASAPTMPGTQPILTFIVGIFNPSSQEGSLAPSNLMTLAQAGGTGSPVIIDVTQNDVTQKLQDALKQAQTKAIACSYTIPPPSHGNADYTKVNVYFNSGGNSTLVKKTSGPAACSQGGWYYDTDPNTDLSVKLPTQIIACPSTCAQFNADTSGSVQIQLDCATIMVN